MTAISVVVRTGGRARLVGSVWSVIEPMQKGFKISLRPPVQLAVGGYNGARCLVPDSVHL
jgi:hypothetical protein